MNKITLIVFSLVILMALEVTQATPASDPRRVCGKSGTSCEKNAHCCGPAFKCGVKGKCEPQLFNKKRQACNGENEECSGAFGSDGRDDCCEGFRCNKKRGVCISEEF